MGKKLSKISCVGGQDGQGRRNKRSKKCRPKLRKRNVEKQTHDLIFVGRSEPSANRVTADRSPGIQGEFTTNKLTTKSATNLPEVVIMPTREIQKLETIAECEEISAEYRVHRLEVPQNKPIGQLIQDTSKKIGNSIDLVPCPDMSTISMFTDPSCVKGGRGIAAGATAAMLQPPNGVTTADEFTIVTPLENEVFSTFEITHSTLTVPPNSVNSQFISGITPLDSSQDTENPPHLTRDSVFAHDLSYIPEHCLDAVFFANYGAGRMVLLNNNSLVASPEYGGLNSGKRDAKPGSSVEVSDGPGLDSDFGASAGVEMRIVSSDFSGANNNATSAAVDRGHVTVDIASIGKTTIKDPVTGKRRASASDAITASRAKKPRTIETLVARNLPVVEMVQPVDSSRRLGYGLVLRDPSGNRRSATVGGPEGLFHATMEWDPYDTPYGNWREYFIPRVSYPTPRPLLCPVEYWM